MQSMQVRKSFQDSLASSSDRPRTNGPIIRSVSQAHFEVRGEHPFATAIAESVLWMNRLNRSVPQEAVDGRAFEIGGGGVLPAQAVSLNFQGGRIWAAILDVADTTVVGRTWVTEITVGEQAGRVHFGARLVNVTGRFDEPFTPSLPRVVRQLISRIETVADGLRLSETACRVTTEDELDDLIGLIDDQSRQLPVVVIADGVERERVAPPETIARRLAGVAHVYSIDAEMAWAFTRRFGKPLSVFDGAARLYRPGFQLDTADPFEHPLWVVRSGSALEARADLVIGRVLAGGISAGTGRDYPRFNVIRQAVAAEAIQARRQTSTDADLIRLFEDENDRLDAELKALRAEFDQWIDETDSASSESERAIAEMKAEVARVRAQNDSLKIALASSGQIQVRTTLRSYDEFQEWADQNLSANIWIAPKAKKEMEKRASFDNPELLGEVLSMLDTLYVLMRRDPGADKKQAYDARLEELGCLDQPCFTDRNAIKSFPEYAVTYQNERYWCDFHIKFGGGTDPRRFFRIYYHWHEDDQILLIGHLPSHLDNKLTN